MPLNFRMCAIQKYIWLPPVEFYMQIGTGGDVLCVSCTYCNSCSQTIGLQLDDLWSYVEYENSNN
ncbi:hypothetical protein PIB30_088516 [Stylosanthes scabra]|uniref:Uncharacterized protein n=1 Tax=Stylosanthes scabra TaxID=79078 RepID=A0ABU6VVK9_9FABA|nr:hypothetical protein [Stylosanthes scabra]